MNKGMKKIVCFIAIVLISCMCINSVNAYAVTWITTIGTTGFQKQEATYWCWVASARNMAVTKVSYVNVTKSQGDVVKKIKGKIQNSFGSLKEISQATKIFNISCKSSYKDSRLSYDTIKKKIYKGGGVIMAMVNSGNSGHAILVYGYSSNKKVKVFDPQGGNIICKYTDLRDGNTLPGYYYRGSVYY